MSARSSGDEGSTPSPSPSPSPHPPRRTRRRLAVVLAAALILILILVLIAAHRPLLSGYARLFRVHDPAPSGALLMLSDTPEAVESFRRHLAPLVLIVSDGPFPFPDLNRAEVQRQVLIRRGVPADAIRVLAPVTPFPDDRQKALIVREFARSHAMRRITVVASGVHTGLMRRTYRRAFRGSGVDVRMLAVANPLYTEENWYTNDEGLVAYFDETIQWLVGLVSP